MRYEGGWLLMAMGLAVLGLLCICLFIHQACSILEIRSLCRQLEEIERGSHMELGVVSRQKHMVDLCRKINRIQRMQAQKLIQHEKAEKQLMQNITGLAHDIRTPLTGAAGYVQLAQECGEAEKRERYLKAANDRMNELSDMLEELFLYAKMTSPDFQINMRLIQVFPLLSECLIGMYRQFEEKGVSPEAEFEQEGLQVMADEEYLCRIFHNLIQNALVHGEGGICIRQTGRTLIFENAVSKMNRPDPEQIFDRFYKTDAARRKGSSGLGLFVVKELAEKMGWQVRAELAGERIRIILDMEWQQQYEML